MNKITLTNDFHGTTINLVLRAGRLSPRQIRRAWRALCGIADCCCSGEAGQRGHGNPLIYVNPNTGIGDVEAWPLEYREWLPASQARCECILRERT